MVVAVQAVEEAQEAAVEEQQLYLVLKLLLLLINLVIHGAAQALIHLYNAVNLNAAQGLMNATLLDKDASLHRHLLKTYRTMCQVLDILQVPTLISRKVVLFVKADIPKKYTAALQINR